MSLGASFLEIPRSKLRSFDDFSQAVKASSSPALFYREGLTSTVTVETNSRANVIFLKNNGKVEAALPLDWQKSAPTSDARTQVLLGALPVLSCGGGNLQALVIGLGSGITAGTMLGSNRVGQLKICELEPCILTASHFFDAVNGRPLRSEWLNSQRVLPIWSDGRAYLTRSPESYDIIVSQPSEPWVSGSSDLFTREFWQLAKSRLRPFGVFCQWLQLYCIDKETLSSLLQTFADVFPGTCVFQPQGGGEIVLIGYPIPAPFELFGKSAVLSDRLEHSGLKAVLEDVGIHRASDLQSDLILSPSAWRNLLAADGKRQLNTDANLMTEYKLPPELLFGESNLRENVRYLHGSAR